MEAKIILIYKDKKEADAVSKAISPDNYKTPENLFIETTKIKNRVITTVKYNSEKLMTFQSTIDDLLNCISVAEMTIKTIKKI
jgi:hypothetical protein